MCVCACDRDLLGENGLPRWFVNQERYYWNAHLFPQMFFLNDARWIAHPVDYVGLIEHEKEAFLWLLDRFVDTSAFNISEIMAKEWHVLRNRHSEEYHHSAYKKYDLDRAQLSDEQIGKICELYWMDFICLPFDVPEQCDLGLLFDTFYGEDKYVVYDYNFSDYLRRLREF